MFLKKVHVIPYTFFDTLAADNHNTVDARCACALDALGKRKTETLCTETRPSTQMGCNTEEQCVMGVFVLSVAACWSAFFFLVEGENASLDNCAVGVAPGADELEMRHCVQLLLQRGATMPSSQNTVKHQTLNWFCFPFFLCVFTMGWSWEADRVVNAGGVTPCRDDDGCWRPLCPCPHSGRGRAAMWARAWYTLAAAELNPHVHVPHMRREIVEVIRLINTRPLGSHSCF